MRGAGIAVGIPLTLLQWGVHQHTGVHLNAWDVANNVCVATAVYDADRIVAPQWSNERFGSRVGALLSCLYYASNAHTAFLAPVVSLLHFGYSSVVKPAVAPVKPFFVALLWTLAIYGVPASRAVETLHLEPLTPAALFLSIASLSHAADVIDRDEDLDEGLHTPAVRMGRAEGKAYAIGLGLASAWLHALSPSASMTYDAFVVSALAGLLAESVEMSVTLALLIVIIVVASRDDVAIVAALLDSTEVTHKIAIDAVTRGIEIALSMAEPWRSWFVDVLFSVARGGDGVGRTLLEAYERVVRERL